MESKNTNAGFDENGIPIVKDKDIIKEGYLHK